MSWVSIYLYSISLFIEIYSSVSEYNDYSKWYSYFYRCSRICSYQKASALILWLRNIYMFQELLTLHVGKFLFVLKQKREMFEIGNFLSGCYVSILLPSKIFSKGLIINYHFQAHCNFRLITCFMSCWKIQNKWPDDLQ